MKQIILILSLMLLIHSPLLSQVICQTGNNKYRKADEYLLMVEIILSNKEVQLQLKGEKLPLSLIYPITSKEKKYLEEAVLEASKNFRKENLEPFEEMFNRLRQEDKNYDKHNNDILAIEMLIRIISTRKE